MTSGVPSARLGGLYGMYFAIVALSIGWFGPFFQALGFSAFEIGIAIGVLTGSKIFAPYLWGTLGDFVPNRLRIVQIGIIGSTFAAGLLLLDVDFVGLCLVLALFGVFWNAIIAQFDTLTLEYLGSDHHRYSSIRVWGSVGFILMMLASGWLFSDVEYGILPWLIIGGLVISVMISLTLPRRVATYYEASETAGITKRLTSASVMLFLVVTALNQLTHGPMNVFFTMYVQSHGYTAFEAGQLWALGVLAEVILFFLLPHYIRSIDLRLLLTLSLVFGSIRWILIGIYPDWPWLLVGLQLLHAFTFGAIHSVSIEFIRRWFPGKLSGRGMALYSGFVFGLGGSLGATLSGITWETFGGSTTFIASGILTGFTALVAWFGLKKAKLGVESL